MRTQSGSQPKNRMVLTALVGLLIASCGDAIRTCLPVALVANLQQETIESLWQRELIEGLLAQVILAKDLEGNLTPTAVFMDSVNQRVAVLRLEQFQSTPVYIIWIDDETQQVSSSSGTYTTIHAIGYIPPELYPGKTMFTADFAFQSKEYKTDVENEFFYRESAFQKGVIWFPIADFDFENHNYLYRIDIDTVESLATNRANTGPGVYSEWEQEFEPAIDMKVHLNQLSQLRWIDYTAETECVILKQQTLFPDRLA